jgi:hypothetical protein
MRRCTHPSRQMQVQMEGCKGQRRQRDTIEAQVTNCFLPTFRTTEQLLVISPLDCCDTRPQPSADGAMNVLAYIRQLPSRAVSCTRANNHRTMKRSSHGIRAKIAIVNRDPVPCQLLITESCFSRFARLRSSAASCRRELGDQSFASSFLA